MTNMDVKLAFKVIQENRFAANSGILHKNTIPIKGTENVKELFQKLGMSFQDVLIVTGSGDQILECILYGAKNIYCFDINYLTKYGSELKYAAVMALEYDEFLTFYKQMFPENLYNKVREFLKPESLDFWNLVFASDYPYIIYHFLFDTSRHFMPIDSNCSIYEEKTYNIIKEKLPSVNIRFTQSNLMSLDDKKIGKQAYDFIYLSNILYYLNLTPIDCANFLKQKITPLLKENGRSVIHYIYKQAGNRSFNYDNMMCNIDARDLKTIETFKNMLNVEEIHVNKSGSGRGSGSQDVALILRKVA